MKKPIELQISGMHCKSCETLTTEELSLLSGVSGVNVSYEKKQANLFLDETKSNESDLIEAVKRAGYTAKVVKSGGSLSNGNGHAAPIVLNMPDQGIKITINITMHPLPDRMI